jgi:hypothetical protein
MTGGGDREDIVLSRRSESSPAALIGICASRRIGDLLGCVVRLHVPNQEVLDRHRLRSRADQRMAWLIQT